MQCEVIDLRQMEKKILDIVPAENLIKRQSVSSHPDEKET